jgi:hypothetical protein
LTWLTTGPSRVRGDGSTLWVFSNKSALRADLRVFLSVGCRGLGCVVPRGPPTHASAGPWGAWIVRTSPHLLRSSDSLKEYEDAGPWDEWFLGGLNNTPQLAPAEHCTVGGSKRKLGRIPPKGRGLDLVDDWTLSRERGRLDVMGFFEQVSTSCGPQSLSKCRMPGLGVCGPSGASNTRLSWPLGSLDCKNKSALAVKLRFSQRV